ncbi:hypothetical protein ABO04_09305 [Nitrosomonas sp. HPC101]|uniref:hypothetical protein n=1 Tax=Nitrosomonas sp. HPC101 TaxID=1658667 RepID=UPI001371E137|nr:hypothetical protein [Nitrosomonas sp. HPC101]MXS86090.1 hypothetical protein [Nitrosomonas sp. HPC101]
MAWENFIVKPTMDARYFMSGKYPPDYLSSIDNPGGSDRDYVPDQSSGDKDDEISILYIQISAITTSRHGKIQRAVATQYLFNLDPVMRGGVAKWQSRAILTIKETDNFVHSVTAQCIV